MSITFDTLQQYFKRYGWEYEVADENAAIVTGFVDDRGQTFAIVVSFSDMFVMFSMPYAALPLDASLRDRVLTKLLRLNYAWPIVKLGIDNDGESAVTAEFAVEGFSYEDLALGLDLLTESVGRLEQEVPELTPGSTSGGGNAAQ